MSHQQQITKRGHEHSLLSDYSTPSVITSAYLRHIWGCFSKQSCLMILEMSPDNYGCSSLFKRCLYSWAAPWKDVPRWKSLVPHVHRKKKNTPRRQINIQAPADGSLRKGWHHYLEQRHGSELHFPKPDTAGRALAASSTSSATPQPQHFLQNHPSALDRTHCMVTEAN